MYMRSVDGALAAPAGCYRHFIITHVSVSSADAQRQVQRPRPRPPACTKCVCEASGVLGVMDPPVLSMSAVGSMMSCFVQALRPMRGLTCSGSGYQMLVVCCPCNQLISKYCSRTNSRAHAIDRQFHIHVRVAKYG
ncbi:hypothetical protein BC834DRAFT_503638 [Gloeopeniophorella convolvens]|nr:hypothetical protein BC834DRAFT_328009 [Gloeopeniophorella convolvens]KAI0260885.1 hypothetical protein BC834DRAFT_503638 [Gloeopeniophorella convolvens]